MLTKNKYCVEMQRRRRYEGVNRVKLYRLPHPWVLYQRLPLEISPLPHPSPVARNCEYTDRAMLQCTGPQRRGLGVSSTGRQQMSHRSVHRRTDECKNYLHSLNLRPVFTVYLMLPNDQLLGSASIESRNYFETYPGPHNTHCPFHLIGILVNLRHCFLSVKLLDLPASRGHFFALIWL